MKAKGGDRVQTQGKSNPVSGGTLAAQGEMHGLKVA